MNLDDLPNEIIVKILENVDALEDIQACHFVSKNWIDHMNYITKINGWYEFQIDRNCILRGLTNFKGYKVIRTKYEKFAIKKPFLMKSLNTLVNINFEKYELDEVFHMTPKYIGRVILNTLDNKLSDPIQLFSLGHSQIMDKIKKWINIVEPCFYTDYDNSINSFQLTSGRHIFQLSQTRQTIGVNMIIDVTKKYYNTHNEKVIDFFKNKYNETPMKVLYKLVKNL